MVSYKQILSVVLAGIGLTSVAALVYLAGPLISIGGWRPLQNYIVREIAILLLVAAFASVLSLRFVKRKKAAAQIAAGIASADKIEDDTGVLKDKMKDALATLKATSGGKADFLYDLPWYVLIGPPGSGKTTALVNSGLKFPLSGGATPAAIAGVGGTRYCDWWFTEDAVMIDTAGRYTTQDSDAKADKQSWIGFLDLLKKNRPRQPINGVLVAISLEDLMTLKPDEIAAHANAIRARLLELHDRLKVDFPVYALFTKCDLVAGFVEYFAGLSDHGRCKVWGATFQTDDKTLNLVAGVPKEFDDLVERLNSDLTDRLQEEPAPANRVLLYGFPTQIAALKQSVFNFLNQIFEPTRYHANATLRGFYFTSGTQHGAPIDRLIGALEKSFGAEQVGARAYSGLGKSYFLTDLILKVIIGEAAWVSTDRGAVRRARIIQACVYSVILLIALAGAGLWWVSYARNRDLIAQTQSEVATYPLQAGGYAHETTISDRDLHNVLPLLHRLRNLPTGYANRDMATPLLATFGLSQRERLQTSAKQVYHIALERLFRPRLVYRLEEVLEAATKNSDATNVGSIYEALKVYLMIGGTVPTDRDLVVSWMRKDWNENLYPGAANESGRKALEEHLLAMFDLEDGSEPLIALNGTLVAECRKYIARLNMAERAYQLLKSQANQSIAPDWVAVAHGGPEFGAVYESATGDALDAIKVPGFYTYAGFQRAFIEKLPTIASQLERDNWVLGEIGTQGVIKDQLTNLGPNLLELYTRDFFPAWMQALGKLRLRSVTADKPKYNVLNAAAAPTSPIKYLFESIRDESVLTREKTAGKDGADADKDRKEAKPILLSPQGGPPGATIEAQFRAFGQALSAQGARRSAVDSVLDNLTEINKTLQSLTLNPAQKQQTTTTLRDQVATLRSNAIQFPAPFSDEMLRWVRQLENVVVGDVQEEIRAVFEKYVAPACQNFVEGKYPLVRGERREATPAEFARVFGRDQNLDAFFQKYLKPYVDTSKPVWVWLQDNPVSADFSPDALRQIQRGLQIRDAFFSAGPLPSFSMTVTPPVLTGRGPTAKLEINGVQVASPILPNATPASGAVSVSWLANGARSAITVTPDGGGAPNVIEGLPAGPWSFFRLLDRGSPTPRGGGVVARYAAFSREFEYQFTPQTVLNPLLLPALRDFKCPTVL